MSGGKGKGKPRRAGFSRMPDWDEEPWRSAREAWFGRGLELPPTPAQRRLLWPVVESWPQHVADWIEEAPRDPDNETTYAIVGHVLGRGRGEDQRQNHGVLWADLDPAEVERWMAIERQDWLNDARVLSRARMQGLGLPDSEPGINPYRDLLVAAKASAEYLYGLTQARARGGTLGPSRSDAPEPTTRSGAPTRSR